MHGRPRCGSTVMAPAPSEQIVPVSGPAEVAHGHQDLAGRAAVVTGAARGIGRVIALAMARAGADLLLCARRPFELEPVIDEIAALGRQGVPCEVDLRDPRQVAHIVPTAQAELGRIDILVNNSGVAGPSAPLWEVDPADWKETLDVNLTGAFLCCRAVAAHMVAQRRGSIVLVGSITGKRPLLHRSPYAASKLGLLGLCRTLALDAGPYGVRANVISPGFVEGPRIDWVIGRQAAAQGRPEADVRFDLEHQAPLQRLVTASEVANAAVFLAGDGASGITGVDLNVAAGAVMY